MKKLRSILVMAIAFAAIKTNAQTSLGIRGGVNLGNWHASTEDGDALPSLENHLGILISVPVECRTSALFAFQPEFSVIEKGVESTIFDPGFSGYTEEDVIKLTYFEIPLICKFALGSEKIKFNFLIGPSFGYALSGKLAGKVLENGHVIYSETHSIDFTEDGFSHVDFGMNFGGALNFYTGSGSFFIDARYQLGLSDLSTEHDNSTTVNSRGIELTAGYLFLLPEKKKTEKK